MIEWLDNFPAVAIGFIIFWIIIAVICVVGAIFAGIDEAKHGLRREDLG